jgi:MoaA/NifB/PqqE/SkfB family radical SAM enzyme
MARMRTLSPARWRRSLRAKLNMPVKFAAYRAASSSAPIFPDRVYIESTNHCNLKCIMCPTGLGVIARPKGYMEMSLYRQIIDEIGGLVGSAVLHSWGEPLMHPDLAEIVAYSNRKNQVSVTTNGFLITQPLIEKLNDAGLSNLEISIDGFAVDRTGYIQKTLKTLMPKLELLKKHATFDVHANIVLCESTKNGFKETVQRIRAMGCHVSVDLLHEADGRIAIQGDDYIKIWDEHFAANNSITDIDYEYGRALLKGEKPKWKCRAGSRALYVDEFGKVQYCSSQRGRPDKNVTEYTLDDLKEQSRTFKGCEEGCALLCIYRDSLLDNSPSAVLRGAYKAISQGVLKKAPIPAQAGAAAGAPAEVGG